MDFSFVPFQVKFKSFSRPLHAILIATAFFIDVFVRDITGTVLCVVLLVYWLCKVSIDEISRT